MKTLRESILDDIDTTMNKGSEWTKEIEKEKKEFLKSIGTINNYDSPEIGINIRRKRTKTLRCRLFAPYTIEQLGFNANAIKIIIGSVNETGDWKIKISIYTVEDKSKMGTVYVKPIWEKTVYIDYDEFFETTDMIKDLLKPAAKSIDSFKKFLNNMEKQNEQIIKNTNLLLN